MYVQLRLILKVGGQMNNIFIRSKHSIKRITLTFLVTLIPLIIAGFYKNGIKLYNENLVDIYGLFKPLIFILIGFFVGVIVNILYLTFKKEKINLLEKAFSSFHPLYGVLVGASISINANIYVFIIVTFIIFLISKLFKESKINIPALSILLIIIILKFTSNFTYLNPYEISRTFDLTLLDYFIGRGTGGVITSHGFLLIFSLLVLSTQKFYKKNISYGSIISFISLIVIYGLYKENSKFILESIFTNGILFAFIYIAPSIITSSYTKYGTLIYGILVGIITFVIYLFDPYISVYIGVLIVSLFHKKLDKYSRKWLK